jgi:urease accessory protein
VGETPASTVLFAATAVVGLAVAIGWPMPAMVGAPIALVVGASIALDSPPRAVSLQAANAALIGTALGAALVVGRVAAIVVRLRREWLRILVRVLGSWIAASAIMVLALRLSR